MIDVSDACKSGEDLAYLSICAISGDWSTLLEEYIRPEYLSQKGRPVAEWVLQKRQTNQDLPSPEALWGYWSGLDWPEDTPRWVGHDPKVFADDILRKVQKSLTLRLNTQLIDLNKIDVSEDFNRAVAISTVQHTLNYLKQISDSSSGIKDIGVDDKENHEVIYGSEEGGFSRLRTMVAELDKAIRPLQSGIYCFFGRPKSTKTWVLLNILYNIAVLQQEPVLVVDPENGREDVQIRLACIHAKLNFAKVQDAKLKMADGVVLTDEENALLQTAHDSLMDLGVSSKIVLMGKEQFDPKVGGIPAEKIFATAKAEGIKVLFIDQMHKVHNSEGQVQKNQNESTMMRRAVEYIDAQPGYAIFCTTQQNRKNDSAKAKMPLTDAGTVFGSDALAQNARFLAHVHKFDLPDDDAALQMISIELNRRSRPSSDKIFLINSFCDRVEFIEEDEGLVLAQMCLQKLAADQKAAADRAAKRLSSKAAESTEEAEHQIDVMSSVIRQNSRLALIQGGKSDE